MIGREISKKILDALSVDKELMDLSDDPSDYEFELKKERQKNCEFSSDDDQNEGCDQEDECQNNEMKVETKRMRMKTEGVIKKTSFKYLLDDDQNEGIDLEDGDQNNQNEGREN